MLLVLPIILSRISHNFPPLFFILYAITYFSHTILQTLLHRPIAMMSTLHMVAENGYILLQLQLFFPQFHLKCSILLSYSSSAYCLTFFTTLSHFGFQ